MKRIVLFILGVVLLMDGYAETCTTNGVTWTYTVSGGKASLVEVPESTSGILDIPATLNGYLVTRIGNGAFEYCSGLTHVTIPDSVTSIGAYAFEGCYNLSSCALPDKLQFLGDHAFYGCASLGDITVPKTATNVEWGVFVGCTGVTNLVINTKADAYCGWMDWFDYHSYPLLKRAVVPGSSSTYANSYGYGYSLTRMFPNLEELSFTEGTASIPVEMCYGLEKLAHVTFPSSLRALGAYCFQGCSALETISLPDGVTTVGDYAFCKCTSLLSADIPDTVTSTGRGMFSGCTKLKIDLYIAGDTYYSGRDDYAGMTGITSVTFGEGVRRIEGRAFRGCTGITNVTFSSTVYEIGHESFSGCTRIEEIVIPASVRYLDYQCFAGCTNLQNVTILAQDLWMSGGDPFYGCPNIKVLNIAAPTRSTGMLRDLFRYQAPSGMTVNVLPGSGRISPSSFMRCDFLENLHLSEGVSSVDDHAFYYCRNLWNVEFPSTLKSLGNYSFSNCTRLRGVNLPDGLETIGDYALSCALTNVVVPASVRWIGTRAFGGLDVRNMTLAEGHPYFIKEGGVLYRMEAGVKVGLIQASTDLAGDFVLPATVRSISPAAFTGCRSLRRVVIPEGVTAIAANLFSGCTNIVEVVVPSTVTNISGTAFRDVSFSAIRITDGNGVYSCEGQYLFKVLADGTRELAGVDKDYTGVLVVPSQVSRVGSYACRDCVKISALVVGEAVHALGDYAFSGCSGLRTFHVGSELRELGYACFASCTNLTAAALPIGVDRIGAYAFEYCSALERAVIESGDVGDYAFYQCTSLKTVCMGAGVSSLGQFACYGCTNLLSAEVLSGDIGSEAFYQCGNLSDITLGEGVLSLGSYAFESCTNLEAVACPESITNIAYGAFYGCKNLRDVHIGGGDLEGSVFSSCPITNMTFGTKVTSISGSILSSNPYIESLVLPSSLTNIASSAFSSCTNLKFVSIGGGVIGDSAFSGCKALTNAILGVDSVGSYAFQNCFGLKTLTLGGSITNIGYDAFYNCTNLTSATILSGDIGSSAFSSATRLTNLVFGDSVTSVGDSAFSNLKLIRAIATPPATTNIGSSAFSACSGVASADLHAWYIGSSAFQSCTNMSSLILHEGLKSIGNDAFEYCSKIPSLKVPVSVTNIGSYAFSDCRALASADIYAARIGNYAFDGCTNLHTVTLHGGLRIIGSRAFAECPIDSIVIPSAVTNIGSSAFAYCTSLAKVIFLGDLPAGVENSALLRYASSVYYPKKYATKYEQLVSNTIFAGYTTEEMLPQVSANVADMGLEYDGVAHTLEVTDRYPLDAVVRYSTNGIDFVSNLSFKDAQSTVVLCVIEADGYRPMYTMAIAEIWPKQISGATVVLGPGLIASGSIQTQAVDSVVLPGFDVTYQVSGNVVSEPGTYTLRVSGTGNYIGVVSMDFSVGMDGVWLDAVTTGGTAVRVPNAWAERYGNRFIAVYGSDLSAALLAPSGKRDAQGNTMYVWQDYVAGTDPTDMNSKLTTTITVGAGGVPEISWTPRLPQADAALREYTIYGKRTLGDTAWTVVTDENRGKFRFFTVGVKMR